MKLQELDQKILNRDTGALRKSDITKGFCQPPSLLKTKFDLKGGDTPGSESSHQLFFSFFAIAPLDMSEFRRDIGFTPCRKQAAPES